MCDPVLAAGAVLQAGGMAANSIGASAAARARQRALQNNVWGQLANQQSAFNAVDQGRAKYENFASGMQKKGAEIGDYVMGNVNAAPPDAMPKSGNVTTQNAEAAAATKTAGQTAQRGRAIAENTQFGDYLHGVNLGAQRDVERSAMFNNFAKGDASLLPGQLEAASHAGDTWSGIGGIANALGRLGVSYGIGQMYTPGAAALGVGPRVLQGATAASGVPLTGAITSTGLPPIY